MSARRRFEKELADFFAEVGAAGGRVMDCRGRLIVMVENRMRERGLDRVMTKYLEDTFGVPSMAKLGDDELARALEFADLLEELTPAGQLMPLRPGMTAQGEACWFRGELHWPRAGR